MAMNFAPYQSSPPESERAKSPPLRSPTSSPTPQQQQHQHRQQPPPRNISSVADHEDPWAAARAQRLPSPSQYVDDDDESGVATGGYQDLEGGPAPYRDRYNDYIGTQALQGGSGGGSAAGGGGARGGSVFATSLGIPLRIEACLAYLVLPPAGGVVLLLFEHQSDYVRFHAWQSALLFTALFLLHLIFTWSAALSWILLAADLLLIAYLAWGAWANADTLDRVELPVVGRLASGLVDDE